MTLTHNKAVLLMIAVTLMWSTAGVVSRQLETAVRFELTFWRSAFTALSLLFILPLWRALERGGKTTASPGDHSDLRNWLRRHWGLMPESRVFWISGFCWSVMFTAFMLALSFTSVANVLVIMSLGPLFTALMARVWLGQKLALRTWLAILAAGAGIVYMYGSQLLQALRHPEIDSADLVLGALIALCVPLAGAIQWTVMQRSQTQGQRIDLVPSVLLGAILSCLFTWPMATPFNATSHDLVWLGLLGLTQLAIPCTLSVVCARVLKAPEVALLALLEVIFGILWVWMWANEVPGHEVMLGGSLVIGALVLNELLGWRSRSADLRVTRSTADA